MQSTRGRYRHVSSKRQDMNSNYRFATLRSENVEDEDSWESHRKKKPSSIRQGHRRCSLRRLLLAVVIIILPSVVIFLGYFMRVVIYREYAMDHDESMLHKRPNYQAQRNNNNNNNARSSSWLLRGDSSLKEEIDDTSKTQTRAQRQRRQQQQQQQQASVTGITSSLFRAIWKVLDFVDEETPASRLDKSHNAQVGDTTNDDIKMAQVNASDVPVPQKNATTFLNEALEKKYTSRLREWQRRGIFYNYAQPAVSTAQTLPPPHVGVVAHPKNQSQSSCPIVVLVLSARNHSDHRRVIRETWGSDRGKGACHQGLYFVVGGSSGAVDEGGKSLQQKQDDLQDHLQAEALQYGDLLDSIHPESYRSLPYKLHYGYRWIVQNVPENTWEWILKVDDDSVVQSLDALYRHVLHPYHAPKVPMVVGCVVPHSPVNRVGKWAELVYPGRSWSSSSQQYYPPWSKGSCGHAVSKPVAAYLAAQPAISADEPPRMLSRKMNSTTSNSGDTGTTTTRGLFYYQGEDTSLGIWLDESPMDVLWIRSPSFANQKQVCLQRPDDPSEEQEDVDPAPIEDTEFGPNHNQIPDGADVFVLGHAMDPLEMRHCFAALQEAHAASLPLSSLGRQSENADSSHRQGRDEDLIWWVETQRQRRKRRQRKRKRRHGDDVKNNNNDLFLHGLSSPDVERSEQRRQQRIRWRQGHGK